MESQRGRPIYSLLVDDEGLERLDAFVVGLGDRIDGIQDAERTGALAEVAKHALELARDAVAFGLPPLADAAERVAASCQRGEASRAHDEIVELTDVVTRVRLGHRGGIV